MMAESGVFLLLNNRWYAWIRNFIVPCLLIAPIIGFVWGPLTAGTANLRMIIHFDIDESTLVEFAGRTYSKGIIPLELQASYPQFFYYLAGIVLFPYTFFKGIDHQAIVIVFRCLNTMAGISTAILLYFLCLRFFNSVFVGILSSLLFITSPGYLWWLLNSRPHPLEIFFILAVFYFSFRLVEHYKLKVLIAAIVFAGLATATKCAGIFTVPVIWAACLYNIAQQKTTELSGYLSKKFKLINLISLFLACIAIIIPLAAISFYLKFQNKFYFLGIQNLFDFIRHRNFKVMTIAAILLFLAALFWLVVNFLTNRLSKHRPAAMPEKFSYLFILNKGILILFYIVASNIAMFLLLNPSYLIYPLNTIKAMAAHFAMTTMTAVINPSLSKPIFDFTNLAWFNMLFFDNRLFNWCFALLFFWYIGYEILSFKKNWLYSRCFLIQRGLLLLYSVVLFLFLILIVHHRNHAYLLPVEMVFGILIALGITQTVKKIRFKFLKSLFILSISILLILGFYTRLGKLIEWHQIKVANCHITDTGIVIGDWLEAHHDSNIKIWKDTPEFYVPPKFKDICFMYLNDTIENNFEEIKKIEPDILIIANPYDGSLGNAQKINLAIKEGKLRGYVLEREFKYEGTLEKNGTYKKIFIYKKLR